MCESRSNRPRKRFQNYGVISNFTRFPRRRLPKMPELKESHKSLSFTPAGPEVNIHGIAFKDKKREEARQAR